MTEEKLVVFGCEESYFFRDGTPFNAGEDTFLPSRFPPSCLVMQGAIRTAIINGHGADFHQYKEGKCSVCGTAWQECQVLRAVGSAGCRDDMELDFYGPFLVRRQGGEVERFYPAPCDLVQFDNNNDAPRDERPEPEIGRLQPGRKARMTDLGMVMLPTSPEGKRYRTLKGAWLSEEGLLAYLKGEKIDHNQLYFQEEMTDDRFKNSGFLKKEERVGIARQFSTRTTKKGMFYAIEHLRLDERYFSGLGERIIGLPDTTLPDLIKLGGEGRMTTLTVEESHPLCRTGIVEALTKDEQRFLDEHCFKLVFLTPVRFSGGWKPSKFKAVRRKKANGEEVDVWQGELAGIGCTLVALCAERTERIGGWDIANKKAKTRYSYLPAGSVLYFTSPHSAAEIVTAMHDRKFGLDTKIGFGHAVIGRW